MVFSYARVYQGTWLTSPSSLRVLLLLMAVAMCPIYPKVSHKHIELATTNLSIHRRADYDACTSALRNDRRSIAEVKSIANWHVDILAVKSLGILGNYDDT